MNEDVTRALIGATAAECAPPELVTMGEGMVKTMGATEARHQLVAFWESFWRVTREAGGMEALDVINRVLALSSRRPKKGGAS